MGLRGPVPKSADLRIHEGERAHRPLPSGTPRYLPGMPDRPKGMTAGARKAWDAYSEQLGPMGILRIVDGFALRRLCEDVALLQELQSGMRRLASEKKREATKAGMKIPGGAMIELAMSHEGRRLAATINTIASRIKRDEMQFGLTPVASQRLENITALPCLSTSAPSLDPVEAALCG